MNEDNTNTPNMTPSEGDVTPPVQPQNPPQSPVPPTVGQPDSDPMPQEAPEMQSPEVPETPSASETPAEMPLATPAAASQSSEAFPRPATNGGSNAHVMGATPIESTGRGNFLLYLGIGTVVVALIIGGAFFYFQVIAPGAEEVETTEEQMTEPSPVSEEDAALEALAELDAELTSDAELQDAEAELEVISDDLEGSDS